MITVALFIAIWFCRHLAIAIVRTSSSPQDPLFPLSLSKSSCSCRRRHLDMYCISSHLICNCRYDPAPLCQGNSIIKQLYCFKNRLWHCHCLNISPLPLSQSQCLCHCHCFSPPQSVAIAIVFKAPAAIVWSAFSGLLRHNLYSIGGGGGMSRTTSQSSATLPSLSSCPSLFLLWAILKTSSAPLSNHFQWLK